MQLINILLPAFLCLLGFALAGPRVPLKNLMQFLEHEHELSREDPRRSLVCFDCYLPLLTVIAEEYEASYGVCIEKAALAKSDIDNSTDAARADITVSMQSSCEIFTACNGLADPIEYFECYANAGSENMKSMYAISANATETLVHVREQYRLIEEEERRCTSDSERNYVKKTGSTYDQLQRCLKETMQPIEVHKEVVPAEEAELPSKAPPTTSTTPANAEAPVIVVATSA